MTMVQSAEFAVAVAGTVESSSLRVAARDRNGCGATQRGKARFGGETFGVVARSAQQCAGGVVADSVTREEWRGDRVEDRLDGSVEVFDFGVEGDPSAGDGDQRTFRAAGWGQRITGPITRTRSRPCGGSSSRASCARMSSGAVSHTLCNWFAAVVRAFIAPVRGDAAAATLRRVRRPLWGPRSRPPASTAWAAISASIGSHFPRRRRR